MAGTLLFFLVVDLLGGATEGDAALSVYSTWAIAHGYWACSYPPIHQFHFTQISNPFALTAPLYPLLTGALAWILRLGHAFAFPSRASMGTGCNHAFAQMFHWSARSSVILPTIRLSYIVWPILAAGVIMVVRAAGLGKTRAEGVALCALAVAPPVFECILDFFHPEDLLAMGFCLVAVAMAMRHRWAAAGVAVGLAVATQQLSVLVAVPLLVFAPRAGRIAYVAWAAAVSAVIDVPIILATSGRAARTVLLGSSRVGTAIRGHGGTVLWELDLHGALLFFIARLLPIIGGGLVAWWVTRQMPHRSVSPALVMAVLALSLDLRLVFEVNLFDYYFMAIAVALVLMDLIRGTLRGTVVAWIALETIAFNPVHWGFYSNWTSWDPTLFKVLPIALLVLMVGWIAADWFRERRVAAYKVAWAVVTIVFGEPFLFGTNRSLARMPSWGWQVVLVGLSLVLVVRPLVSMVAEEREDRSPTFTSST